MIFILSFNNNNIKAFVDLILASKARNKKEQDLEGDKGIRQI